MAVTDTLPTQDAAGLSIADWRLINAGQIVRDTSGIPRLGVFPAHTNPIVTSTATMNVAVAPFVAAVSRTGNATAELLANDASTNVLLPAAPGANSRIDVIWVRPQFVGAGDAGNVPLFGSTQGTASASPVKPSIPAGALELATVQIPSTATATNSGGVVITQTFLYTAASGGTVLLRSLTEQNAWSPTDGSLAHRIDTEEIWQRRSGAWKIISRPDIDWIQLARSTGWTDVTGHTANICRRNGMVVIEGAVTKGAGGALSSILTVPAWARPSTGTQFVGASVTNSGANVSEIYVQSDGIMGINGYTTIAGGASAIVVPVSTSYTPR